MRWDEILEAWTDRLAADPALLQLLGGVHIYPAAAGRAVRVPSLEYLLLTDREDELFNPIGVQVDLFARGTKAAAQLERRVRVLTHHDVAQELAGERMWLQYLDGRSVSYEAEPGVVHRVLDFEFKPVRAYHA